MPAVTHKQMRLSTDKSVHLSINFLIYVYFLLPSLQARRKVRRTFFLKLNTKDGVCSLSTWKRGYGTKNPLTFSHKSYHFVSLGGDMALKPSWHVAVPRLRWPKQ